jgi:hypothetical protein
LQNRWRPDIHCQLRRAPGFSGDQHGVPSAYAPRLDIFDMMSATASIDPKTQSLAGTFHWFGLTICFLVSAVLLLTTGAVIQARGF